MDAFLSHVKQGLSQTPKKLSSRYFYDEKGDDLFIKIMNLEDYYLPEYELNIIKKYSSSIASEVAKTHSSLEVVELGAGSGSKTKLMLEEFLPNFEKLSYVALDISEHVLEINKTNILNELGTIVYSNSAGNYFETYKELESSKKARLILFLGANIGNFQMTEIIDFFHFIKKGLKVNDYVLVAFDMVKHPRKIIKAYDDSHGITKAFNLNLLSRINRELGGNFNEKKFDHYPFYNPITGVTSSQIISLEAQDVRLKDGSEYHFEAFESIHTEISKKFFPRDIEYIARESGLTISKGYPENLTDYALVLFKV